MAYSEDAIALHKPAVADLPRLEDWVSFVYLDRARVVQEQTGVVAYGEGGPTAVHLPVASAACVLLGPGTSVTSSAMATLHRHGTIAVFCGEGGAVGYAAGRPLTSSARWAQAQARMWADQGARLCAARELYQRRWPDLQIPAEAPIRVLRGMEGQRVKQQYRELSRKYRWTSWRRESDPAKASDPVNRNLNIGNAILYGVAASAVHALGMSPALGVIHHGHASSFLFDLADVWKGRIAIPLAFSTSREPDSVSAMRRAVREQLHGQQVMSSMLRLSMDLVSKHVVAAESENTLLDENGFVPGNVNHAGRT